MVFYRSNMCTSIPFRNTQKVNVDGILQFKHGPLLYSCQVYSFSAVTLPLLRRRQLPFMPRTQRSHISSLLKRLPPKEKKRWRWSFGSTTTGLSLAGASSSTSSAALWVLQPGRVLCSSPGGCSWPGTSGISSQPIQTYKFITAEAAKPSCEACHWGRLKGTQDTYTRSRVNKHTHTHNHTRKHAHKSICAVRYD